MIFVSTTSRPVEIDDLGSVILPYPLNDYNLTASFTDYEVYNSKDIQSALMQGLITLKNRSGDNIDYGDDLSEAEKTNKELSVLINTDITLGESYEGYKYLYFETNERELILELGSPTLLKNSEFIVVNQGAKNLYVDNVVVSPGTRITLHSQENQWNIYL